jgi:hypothetical protein
MKKPEKTIILLTLFTILTLISIITLYAAHQAPTQETTTNTLCTYTSTATYDYTATLEPNTIYNNKTTLKPNEGTLYTRITKQINITLTYTFEATLPTEATITYNLTQALKTAAWTHPMSTTTQTTTNQTQIQITIPPINRTELETIKRQIEEKETGTSSTAYAFEITPTFTVNANTTAGPVQQAFTPKLTINSKRTDQGDIITIEDLQQTNTGAITENQTITRQDILNQRYTSYILIAISIAGLFFSTYFYIKTKPKTEQIPLDKIIAPYKDLIIEAKEPPKTTPETTIINVETIQELAKTAEILAKPIILTRKPQPTLTIIDQNTIYQHKP